MSTWVKSDPSMASREGFTNPYERKKHETIIWVWIGFWKRRNSITRFLHRLRRIVDTDNGRNRTFVVTIHILEETRCEAR